MVPLRSQSAKTGLNIAQALAIGQLREDHGQILIPAGETARAGIALITRYAATKLAVRKKGNQLLKDGVPVVHAPSSTTPARASNSPGTIQIAAKKNAT
jgi:hypothetical protein